MPDQARFEQVFAQLRRILQQYAPQLRVGADGPASYSLDAPPSPRYPKGMFFGAVAVQKRYVSFYLMPVYMFADLLAGVSDPLRKRKQGKSCFNFTAPLPDDLLSELAELTRAGYERYRREQLA
jgi:hypothetical protein